MATEDLGEDQENQLGLASSPYTNFADPLAFARTQGQGAPPGLRVPGATPQNILQPRLHDQEVPASPHQGGQANPLIQQEGAQAQQAPNGLFGNVDALLQARAAAGMNLGGGGPTASSTPGGATSTRPGHYSLGQMTELAKQAGFDDRTAPLMASIAQAESSGFAGAKNVNRNGTTDYGLTQINSVHGEDYARGALDPLGSFKKAFELSKGGKDFSPWVTYNTGAYKKYYSGEVPAQTGAPVGPLAGAGAGGLDQQKLWKYMLLRTLFPQFQFHNINYDPWAVHRFAIGGGY